MQAKLDGKVDKITAEDVTAALERKYRDDNYLKFQEFDEYETGRRVDLLAISLVRSRPGIHGIEVKVNRSDWIREMNTAQKADAFYFCDYYYLASPPDVWQHGEVPQAWGILEYKNGKIKTIREPTKLDARYDFMFLKTLLGRTLTPSVSPLTKQYSDGYDQGYKDGQKSGYAQLDYNTVTRERDAYKENVTKFEEITGIKINSVYQLGDIGGIVKRIQQIDDVEYHITSFGKSLARTIEKLQHYEQELNGGEK